MLATLVAGLMLLASQSTPTLDEVKGCLSAAVARLDDGVSDASAIAQGAVESCDDMIGAVVAGIVSQDRALNSSQGRADIRQDLEAKLTKIAVQDVLEERAQRRGSGH